jgi:hypothetical protein
MRRSMPQALGVHLRPGRYTNDFVALVNHIKQFFARHCLPFCY